MARVQLNAADRSARLREIIVDSTKFPDDSEENLLTLILSAGALVDNGEFVPAHESLQQAEALADNYGYNHYLPEIHRLSAILLGRKGNTKEAFQLQLKAYSEAEVLRDQVTSALSCLSLGALAAREGDIDQATLYLYKIIEFANQGIVGPSQEAQAHLILAQSQFERAALEEAHFHAQKSLDQSLQLGVSSRAVTSALLLASIQVEREKLPEAREVLSRFDSASLTPFQRVSLLNISAKLERIAGETSAAISLHDQAIELSAQTGIVRLKLNSIELKCETLIAQQQYEPSILLLDELPIDALFGYDLLTYHELKGKALEGLRLFEEALDEHKKFAILQKELLSERASNALSRLRAAQEVLQAEREAAHFRERSQFYAKELSQRTSYLVQQNEYVNNVIDHIQELTRMRPEASDMLKDIRKRLRELPAASFDWNEYLRLFDEIHPSALTILQQQYPDLSPTESKICSLVLAKLSNVDIARLLACSERTVENHRHRLRKKLGLAIGVDLTSFLERTLADHPGTKRANELASTNSVQ